MKVRIKQYNDTCAIPLQIFGEQFGIFITPETYDYAKDNTDIQTHRPTQRERLAVAKTNRQDNFHKNLDKKLQQSVTMPCVYGFYLRRLQIIFRHNDEHIKEDNAVNVLRLGSVTTRPEFVGTFPIFSRMSRLSRNRTNVPRFQTDLK